MRTDWRGTIKNHRIPCAYCLLREFFVGRFWRKPALLRRTGKRVFSRHDQPTKTHARTLFFYGHESGAMFALALAVTHKLRTGSATKKNKGGQWPSSVSGVRVVPEGNITYDNLLLLLIYKSLKNDRSCSRFSGSYFVRAYEKTTRKTLETKRWENDHILFFHTGNSFKIQNIFTRSLIVSRNTRFTKTMKF